MAQPSTIANLTALLHTPIPPLQVRFLGAPWKNTPLVMRDSLFMLQYHSLLLLESAFRGDAVPADIFLAYSKENRGHYRRTLRLFANRLQSGLPIVDALEQTPEVVDAETVVALRHALATGTLPETFEVLKSNANSRRQSINRDLGSVKFYWLVVGMTILVILMYISIKIMPTFQKILYEFDVDNVTSPAIYISITKGLLLSLPWVVLAIILLSITGVLAYFRTWLRRSLFPMLTFTQDLLSTANILRLLGIQVSKTSSLNTSLSVLAKYHPRNAIRRKLLFARNEAEMGINTWQALHSAGLLSTEESVALQKVSDPASQAWILSKLADGRDYRADILLDRFVIVLTPLLTLLWGAIVAWTAIVIFTSLVQLMVSLA
jgi:type II secretory pathway component PulF